MNVNSLALAVTLACGSLVHTLQAGLVIPFTEDFDSDAANWYNGDGTAEVDWIASGGPDGGAYVTASVTVPDPAPPFGITMFRGQDEFGSSGGAFEGDWIAAGVTQLSFFVRHDASAPLGFQARIATPSNFPGAAGLDFVPVEPGVWTEVTIDVTEGSPQLFLESTYEGTFSNVGHLQLGISPTDAFIGETIHVDIDKVTIMPAPGAMSLLLIGAVGLRRRRR